MERDAAKSIDDQAHRLVHCRAGWERTAAVLRAYVARRDGLCWSEALRQLQTRRPAFRLWPKQEAGVREWTGQQSGPAL